MKKYLVSKDVVDAFIEDSWDDLEDFRSDDSWDSDAIVELPPGGKWLTREQFMEAHEQAVIKVCEDILNGYRAADGNRFPGYLADELFGDSK